MDRHGLLTVLRNVSTESRDSVIAKANPQHNWQWMVTRIMYPESKCSFCGGVIRSPGIWLLKGPNNNQFVGALFPTTEGRLKLIQPNFPHM